MIMIATSNFWYFSFDSSLAVGGSAQSEKLQHQVQTAARPGGFFISGRFLNKGAKAVLSTTDDLRISELKELTPPQEVMREVPRTLTATRIAMAARNAIHGILHGTDDRLLVVVGPCSVHDPEAAVDYAGHLAALREKLFDRLEIVMRVYFEKPRTTVGWKGLINDPDLDGSFNINKGLHLARSVLSAVNNLGLPAGTEFLDMTTPQ